LQLELKERATCWPRWRSWRDVGISLVEGSNRHSIVTVNVIEDAGAPLLAVPVRVAVVLPVAPLELLPLPPPHATIPATTAITTTARALFHRNSCRRALTSARNSKRTSTGRSSPFLGHGRMPFERLSGRVMLADVVFTVTVTGTVVVLDVNVTELGLKLHVAAVGRSEHARLTVPVYPFTR
jgi:hypothetical protein